MYLDLTTIKKVFFIGIGGIGISAIARMMLLEGKEVHGSDMADGSIVQELREQGAHIAIGQGFDLIPDGTDLIVYTIAIKHYDPALMDKVAASGIAMKSYPEMLHIVTRNKYTIAVSGTHGKTTTTAMIAKVLIEARKDPSVIVGSLLLDYHSNLIVGTGEHFVVEACEYERSFLQIEPKIAVITNIEADHLDYYKDLADIESAFASFIGQTGNAVVCDPSDESVRRVLKGKDIEIVDYTQYMQQVPKLLVPGEHNRKDAAAALAVADYLGIPMDVAVIGIAQFKGTWRRLEMKGKTAAGTVVYDDYAHHPTEVKASLSALRELYPRGETKVHVLFQPHLYSRTKALFSEFSEAFTEADTVSFLPIYFAREEADPTISSEILAEAVAKHVPGARAFASFDDAEAFFKGAALGSSDVFVTMGAGQAYKIGDALL